MLTRQTRREEFSIAYSVAQKGSSKRDKSQEGIDNNIRDASWGPATGGTRQGRRRKGGRGRVEDGLRTHNGQHREQKHRRDRQEEQMKEQAEGRRGQQYLG